MRITKDSLLRLARDMAAIRINEDHSIVCIYLTGSMLTDNPFIGGSTDIDLFFVHAGQPVVAREVKYLNDDVTLDIAHIDQMRFQQPRRLRADPWLGPFLCAKPKVLFDTHHWFEFTEASVAAQFYRPEYILERSRPLAAAARQTWMNFHLNEKEVSPLNVLLLLDAVEKAGNSLALLSGPPLVTRRFFSGLSTRLEKAGKTNLLTNFQNFILPQSLSDIEWTQWITAWESIFKETSERVETPTSLLLPRKNYYVKAVTELSAEEPLTAAWILMNCWTRSAAVLDEGSTSLENWRRACAEFMLIKESFDPVMEKLDSLLDLIEEILDTFESENGLSQ
jgi:hypothetical protein